ncbi:aromatic amino acid lyase [Halobellus sp. GM3]|uniref:aromatic amino acid lyase n=1 Tax=Halobellus sp. GM3 TaxID=3458410 RepID=UPI00403D58B6
MSSSTDNIAVDGESLTLEEIAAVARENESTAIPDGLGIYDGMEASIDLRNELIDQGVPLYGITTGFGDSVHRQISPDKAAELQERQIRMLGAAVGDTLPREAARAVTLIRANNLVRGHSAIRVELVERLIEMLNCGIVPVIPQEGSVGASGDLAPLSYVAAALLGDREVYYDGEIVPTEDALEAEGLDPLNFEAKEGLALVNGTAYMTGVGALATVDARRLALLSDVCTAMATEVLNGIATPFDSFIHDEAKPHDGQVQSAANVRWLLEGSDLANSYDEVVDKAGTIEDEDFRELSVNIQDKYSLRCAPHFSGVLWDTLEWTEEWLETEVNSSNDNPLFDVDSRQVFSGGNFAGGHVALAMDSLKNAVASIADLLDRQLELVVDEKFNHGLTPNLIPELPEGHPEEGLNHGFKGMQIVCSSLTAEALNMGMPMTAFSRSTEAHNQDKVSMGATAARQTRDVVDLVEKVAAIHLLALCQAADLRGPDQLGRTKAVYDRVREEIPPLDEDRAQDADIEAVVELLRDGTLLADIEAELAAGSE